MDRKYVNGEYLTFYQQLSTNNPCYKKNQKRTKTTHLILHSTGANNPNLKRYVQPDDGYIGVNPYGNSWNSANSETLVHGVIGKNEKGVVECYQIAPWALRVWGVGSGKNGNGNDFTIQLEMAEDQTLGATYAKQCYNVAVKMYAQLCKGFGIDPNNIWSHTECCKAGYGSNHGDPEMWWKAVGAGLTMDGFRRDVKSVLGGVKEVRYATYADVPEWAKQTVKKLMDNGYLTGKSGSGENAVIDLSADMVRILVVLDRSGVFG